VAAYRDRYQITTNTALGTPAQSVAQKTDAARARAALDATSTLTKKVQDVDEARRVTPSMGRSL
jgi:hypothetical protein